MEKTTVSLKPRKSIQVNSGELDQSNENQLEQPSDTQKSDDRSKFFFRVKIGGSSQPQSETTATFTGTSSPKEQEAVSNLEITFGAQSPPTDLSKTSDRFGFGNPFAPPNSKSKFTDSFDPNQPLNSQELLKGIANNTLEIEKPEQNTDTSIFSLLNTASVSDNTNLPETARELFFDSLKGEILGRPYYKSSSDQHSSVKFTIFDPDDIFRPQIIKLENVEIEAGFVNGFKRNIFVGMILDIARKLPDGTVIEAVDNSYELQQTSGGVNPSVPTTTPTTTSPITATSDKSGDYSTKNSFTGEASFYGNSDGFQGNKTANGEIFDTNKLTAAHNTLPFNTMVRVTNIKNNKSVIVRINDRGPYSGGRVLDLSVAAAKSLDMVSNGIAQVKAEVLEKKKDASNPAPSSVVAKGSTINEIKKQSGSQNSSGESQFIRKSNAETFSADVPGLKFAETSPSDLSKQGEVMLQQSKIASAELEAALTGKVLTTRGNTLFAVAPGEAKSSGVILDYSINKAAFIDYPTISKRTNLSLQPATGSITVKGYDVTNKQVIGATVVTPDVVKQHPTGIIQAPEWGSIKLSDPIFPGCPYTWADATKNGSRVPEGKEIMQSIIRIAQIITEMTKETGQTKWRINSWYRPAAANRSVGGKKGSRHLRGDAVDFYFPNENVFFSYYRKLDQTWPGGVALGNRPKYDPPFIHVDARHQEGEGRARWFY